MCELRGGHPYVNLGGYRECGKVYADAGKVCKSSEECEGDCFLPWDWDPKDGKEPIGECEDNDTPDTDGCLPIENKEYKSACVEE
jgi:hypothetical protein